MPKIESLVAYAMPDIPSKFQKDPSITFRDILVTHRQTNKNGKNITSLVEVINKYSVLAMLPKTGNWVRTKKPDNSEIWSVVVLLTYQNANIYGWRIKIHQIIHDQLTGFIANWKDKIQGLFKDFQGPKIAFFKYQKHR